MSSVREDRCPLTRVAATLSFHSGLSRPSTTRNMSVVGEEHLGSSEPGFKYPSKPFF